MSRPTLGKLRNTLKLTGSYSDEAIDSFKSFSHEMEKTTTLTQEQTFTMLALSKAIGISDGASILLVKTAKNLSAVTGRDVNDAMHMLLSSLKGNVRELAIFDPSLKRLSTSALMSGAAVEQIAKKFDGFAQASAKAYKGIIAQSENFKEEI